jgi:hypothetical protein
MATTEGATMFDVIAIEKEAQEELARELVENSSYSFR